MPDLKATIRDTIALYVEDYITAAELNDRLPDGWDLDQESDPATTDLVMLVIGYLSEYHDGDLSGHELRQALARHAGWSVQRTATVTSLTGQLELQVRVAAGTEPLTVSVS